MNVNHHWETDYTELLEAHHLLKARYLKMKNKLHEVEEENTRLIGRYEHKIEHQQHQQHQQHNSFTVDDINAIKMQVLKISNSIQETRFVEAWKTLIGFNTPP